MYEWCVLIYMYVCVNVGVLEVKRQPWVTPWLFIFFVAALNAPDLLAPQASRGFFPLSL